MPYAIDFPIGNTDHPPPSRLYGALYANLIKWFEASDAELAKTLHERPACKPFTISALTQDRDGRWRWRVTLLQDDLFDALWAGVQSRDVIDLNGRIWPVRWQDATIVHCSYRLLLTNVYPMDSIKLRFLSPTTLRKDKMDFPLPDPSKVFEGWLNHWNQFAPTQCCISTDLLEVVKACVAISAHWIRARKYDLGSTQVRGFVGRVIYRILNPRELNQAQVWQLNALADYAEFCGTGRKTTHGLGQTRRLRPGR